MKEIEITYDNSAQNFMLAAFGYYYNEGGIFKEGRQAKCVYCKTKIIPGNLKGFIKDGKTVCDNETCIKKARKLNHKIKVDMGIK